MALLNSLVLDRNSLGACRTGMRETWRDISDVVNNLNLRLRVKDEDAVLPVRCV